MNFLMTARYFIVDHCPSSINARFPSFPRSDSAVSVLVFHVFPRLGLQTEYIMVQCTDSGAKPRRFEPRSPTSCCVNLGMFPQISVSDFSPIQRRWPASESLGIKWDIKRSEQSLAHAQCSHISTGYYFYCCYSDKWTGQSNSPFLLITILC